MDANFEASEFVIDDWCANIADAHQLFRENGTDPETWQGMPFFFFAYLETQETPSFVRGLWESHNNVTAGNWLMTTWLEEWKGFHSHFMNAAWNKSLAIFLETPWRLYDLMDLTSYQIRPVQQLQEYNSRMYERQYREYSVLADERARPDPREGARRRLHVANVQQKKKTGPVLTILLYCMSNEYETFPL